MGGDGSGNYDGDDQAANQQQQAADDYYSLRTNDDYMSSSAAKLQQYSKYWPQDDDAMGGNYYSTQKTFGWFDNLLHNTTADGYGQGTLVPIEDVNPDNVLATFLFNCIICVILLGLYEILRRLIPSVYSQRIVHAQRKDPAFSDDIWMNGPPHKDTSKLELQFAAMSKSHASGSAVLAACHTDQTPPKPQLALSENNNADTAAAEEDEYLGYSTMDDINSTAAESTITNTPLSTSFEKLQLPQLDSNNFTNGNTSGNRSKNNSNGSNNDSYCCLFFGSGLLEWFCPIYSAPWSVFRDLAGLDAYFFLRYIRMCFKITAVSTIWATIILCPVYATGGGEQTGFYHFSMANILQNDKGRVWVPTIFCYAFTLYCWFCVRKEMIHYVKLRMVFLGGEEEQQGRMIGSSSREEEEEVEEERREGWDAPTTVYTSANGTTTLLASDLAEMMPSSLLISSNNRLKNKSKSNSLKQHRYSLLVEKIPTALRSNTALFNYFNDIFPGQIHSVCIAMNVPDLDNLSSRRLRVTRRLEKSLAYYKVTGIRPCHMSGRPRCYCCGIESTPIDALCVACCCFLDTWRMDRCAIIDDDDETTFPDFYDELPGKGEMVDSISYYIKDLAQCNLQMQKLQKEKLRIAQGGGDIQRSGAGMEWYTETLVWAKENAKVAAESLQEKFHVFLDEDEPFPREGRTKYGSFQTSDHRRKSEASLVHEDHLVTDGASDSGDTDTTQKKCHCISLRRHSKADQWLRTLLWRGGVDFLAAGLDDVRNSTDVVVDSITCPSMSSTGFITFKTLTPVTVSTSVPLTYNNDPIDVCIAPEPRDLQWKNVSIDKDIGATREFVANIFLSLGLLLWSIPLTLIQAWAKVDNVARIPGLEWIATINDGAYKALINGYLPVVVLLALICVLPHIFNAIATYYEKRKTFSGVENSIVGRYFYYQLANIYITVTAGALWTSLGAIIDHPQHLLYILGNSLPKLAGYFISLLLTKTFAGLPIVLLRPGALSRMTFLKSCFNRRRLTQRELDEVHRKQPIYYGWEYPTQFLAIIICFTYACITPFILPVGAAYFFFALVVYKKQSLYVYTPTYDSGGSMFPQAISKTMFALMISQLTFIGYTLIRKGVFQIILLAPLPFLTVYFNSYIDNRYVKPSTTLSLERAVKIDALQKESRDFSDDAYQQPVLTEKTLLPKSGDCESTLFNEVINKLKSLHKDGLRGETILQTESV